MLLQKILLEFQFLIGSLEAGSRKTVVKERPKFQFLIGSLEASFTYLYRLEGKFQFLIGSLEAYDRIPRTT